MNELDANATKELIRGAIARLRIMLDPTDEQCGIDGIARKEIADSQYVQSWILPRLENALGLLGDGPFDREYIESEINDVREHVQNTAKDAPLVRNPFSRMRVLEHAEEAVVKVHEARRLLDEAFRSPALAKAGAR